MERSEKACDAQFQVEDRELRLNYRDDRVEGRHLLPFAINKIFKPNAEFDIASLESGQMSCQRQFMRGKGHPLAMKTVRDLNARVVR